MNEEDKQQSISCHCDSEETLWLCEGKDPESGWEGMGCLRKDAVKFLDSCSMCECRS